MKKLISIFLLLLFIFSFQTVVFASNDVSVTIDGNPIIFTDIAPTIINDRTYIPVRTLAENLNAKIEWQETDRIVKITKTDNKTTSVVLASGEKRTFPTVSYEIILQIDNPIITSYKNFTNWSISTEETMDVTPIILNNRTLLPARYIANALGYEVTWDDKTRTVNCNFTGIFKETKEENISLPDDELLKTVLNGFYTYSPNIFNEETKNKIEKFLGGDNTHADELAFFILQVSYTDTYNHLSNYYKQNNVYKTQTEINTECLNHFKNLNISEQYHKYFKRIDDNTGKTINSKYMSPDYDYKILITPLQ